MLVSLLIIANIGWLTNIYGQTHGQLSQLNIKWLWVSTVKPLGTSRPSCCWRRGMLRCARFESEPRTLNPLDPANSTAGTSWRNCCKGDLVDLLRDILHHPTGFWPLVLQGSSWNVFRFNLLCFFWKLSRDMWSIFVRRPHMDPSCVKHLSELLSLTIAFQTKKNTLTFLEKYRIPDDWA